MNLRTPSSSADIPLIPLTIATGATSIVAQIILLREIQSVLTGNELVIGIVLAAWMVLSGAGALAAKALERSALRDEAVITILLVLSVIPIVTVVLIRSLRNAVFTSGSMVTIVGASISALVVLAPYCLLSGFAFALLSRSRARNCPGHPVAEIYVWEAVGSAAGGIAVIVALALLLDAIRVLSLMLAADVVLVGVIAYRRRRHALVSIAIGLAAVAAAIGLSGKADESTRTFLYPGQEIVTSRDTPYGNITVTRQAGQVNVFENSLPYCSTNDPTTDEENVHYAMIQHPSAQSVLMIGGGITNMAGEILKYGVERVDCVEMNPWLVDLGRQVIPGERDRRVHILIQDARRYVETTDGRYDVVLLNLPEPGTAQINRFYTEEFFLHARSVMRTGGVLSASLLPAGEYRGGEARALQSILVTTMRRAFHHVIAVPGQRTYFIGSDRPLDTRIGTMIGQRGISTVYVNAYYIDDELLARRSGEIMASIDTASEVNTDFRPVSYYRQSKYWLSYFGVNPLWFLLPLGLLSAAAVRRMSVPGFGIFSGGMTGMSLEVVLLITFQILCGSMYQMIGIVVTAFMTGLACGAAIGRSVLHRPGLGVFSIIQGALAALSFTLPVLLLFLRGTGLPAIGIQWTFAALACLVAVLVGIEFAVASKIRGGSPVAVASELYGLDLLGSAVGALGVSAFAVPLLGVLNTCFVIGGISLAGALVSCIAWLAHRPSPAVHV